MQSWCRSGNHLTANSLEGTCRFILQQDVGMLFLLPLVVNMPNEPRNDLQQLDPTLAPNDYQLHLQGLLPMHGPAMSCGLEGQQAHGN